MNPQLVALAAAILLYLGPTRVSEVDDVGAYTGQIVPIGSPAGSFFNGWTFCDANRTGVVIDRRFFAWDSETVAHELLHAVDCRDDGMLNGSPLPGRAHGADPMHEWTTWALAHPEDATCLIAALPR